MMKKYILGLIATILIPLFASAQGFEECGTVRDAETFELMRTRALANRQVMDSNQAEERDDVVVYIPIKFHVIGKSDGTSFARTHNILGLLCKLNEEYAEHEIQFYINDGFNFIQSDAAYNNPADSPTIMNINKVNHSVNVYIGNNANPPGTPSIGVTLGYYSPNSDWIVLKKSEANYSANTLPHEMGHFLSLNHPFFGWDCTYWEEYLDDNPSAECAPFWAPCWDNPVERQDGSNCTTAGDYLCDTPPDYNLGFQAPSCSYNGTACDPQGTQVEPMANNIMGYFDGCDDFVFTPDQVEMMLTDYDSFSRNYLRIDGGPLSTELVGGATVQAPADNADLDYYNSVALDWDAVPNAESYVVQTAFNSGFSLFMIETIVPSSGALIDYLDANTTYYWRVKGYNEYSTCAPWSDVRSFTTGGNTTGIQKIQNVADWNISPNPTSLGSNFSITLEASKAFNADITITSIEGKTLKQINNKEFSRGENTIRISTNNLSSGLYFVSLRSDNAVLNKRMIITE